MRRRRQWAVSAAYLALSTGLLSVAEVSAQPPPAGAYAASTTAPRAAPPPGHPAVPPGHPAVPSQGHAMPALPEGITGSPFASPAHQRLAEHLRTGRATTPKAQNHPGEGIPPGTIGMLVRDGNLQPVAGQKVTLNVVRESIAEGNRESTREAITDAEGRAGFVNLNTESSYRYEAVVQRDGAEYSSGAFNLRKEVGQIISLYVYPVTEKLEDTFVVTRALYAIQPREDVFQVDAILRFHNAGPKTWAPKDFYVNLPEEAGAFRPATTESDLRTRGDGNRVHITGSFTPGQHDLTFGFQLPNPRTPTIRLDLPTLPHLLDARVVVESSEDMSLQVLGFEPAQETRGQEGQSALMASQDFVGLGRPAGTTLATVITGMPGRGSGPWIASLLAGLLALFGVAFAISRKEKGEASLSQEDRVRARDLLLDELVAVEKAFAAKEIGPKTYEQARRTLLDSIARLESSKSGTASSPDSGSDAGRADT